MSRFRHEALVHASDHELVSALATFLAGGSTAGEPAFAVLRPETAAKVRAALPDPDAVMWVDAAERYDRPASAIRNYRQMMAALVRDGAQRIRVAGELPGEPWDSWARYEAAINRAYDEYPLWAVCVHDRRRLGPEQLTDVYRTHPHLTRPATGAQGAFTIPDLFLSEQRPVRPDAVQLADPYAELVDPAPALARQTTREAGRTGAIPPDELENLVVAVSEVVTNAMLHGRPPIVMRLWRGADRMVVTVTDAGAGPSDPYAGLLPLSPTATSGRGLWITFQTVAQVDSWRDADGYTVRLIAR